MSKKLLALDIDDVLSDSAEGFIGFCNSTWGTNLTLDDYTEHWAEMWRIDSGSLEFAERVATINNSKMFPSYTRKDHAREVLSKLHETFQIIAVTSRRRLIEADTRDWIHEHYEGIIDDIVFAGIYDTDDTRPSTIHERLKATKGDLLKDLNANYFIDDQLKHCDAAVAYGIPTILFGDYPWNSGPLSNELITRCSNWQAVEHYFETEGLL